MMFTNKAKSDSLDIPVKKIFDQWLKENQIPTLTLENVKQDMDSLRFEINQDLQFYLPVPVRIYTATDTIRQNFTIKDKKNSFAFKTNAVVKSITVDPDYQCLRRLNKWEIPFSFGLTLSDNPLLILPSKSSKDYKVAEDFSKLVIESEYKVDFKSVDDLKESDWADRSIIVLGNTETNQFFGQMKGHYPAKIDLNGNDIAVDKQKFKSEGNLLLLNCTNPKNADKYASVIYCGNMENTEQFRRLFHYLSYSMVLVSQSKMGRPLSQLEIFPEVKDKKQMEYIFNK